MKDFLLSPLPEMHKLDRHLFRPEWVKIKCFKLRALARDLLSALSTYGNFGSSDGKF